MRHFPFCGGVLLGLAATVAAPVFAHGVFLPGRGFKTLDKPTTCADMAKDALGACEKDASVVARRNCLLRKQGEAEIFPAECRGEFIRQTHDKLQKL